MTSNWITIFSRAGWVRGAFYDGDGVRSMDIAKQLPKEIAKYIPSVIPLVALPFFPDMRPEVLTIFGASMQNCIDIIFKASNRLNKGTDLSKIDVDWRANFFDKARLVSDDDMQGLWAKILAGEANKPGTYSKRCIRFISDMDKEDAEHFTTLHRFCWRYNGLAIPIIFYFDKLPEFYVEHGITESILNHLEDIGIIEIYRGMSHSPTVMSYRKVFDFSRGDRDIFYFGRKFTAPENIPLLEGGPVCFTKVGEELVTLSTAKPIEGYYDYVTKHWEDEIRRERERRNSSKKP